MVADGWGVWCGRAALAALIAVVVEVVRAYLHIPAPARLPSAVALGLPAAFARLANARDVAAGAKRAAGGRAVRRGLLYRTAKLSGLPDGDRRQLQRMGVRAVADFRSAAEAAKEPDSFADGHEPEYTRYDVIEGDPRAAVTKAIRTGMPPGWAAEYQRSISRNLVKKHSARYRDWLISLTRKGGLPGVVHCTAGKDRTGWAVALLLLILGVDEETVMQDYLLSNDLWYRQARKYVAMIRLFSGFRVKAENCAPLLLVRNDYIEASLDAVKATHGSIERYATAADGLGLEEETITSLREMFLEPAVPG